MSNLAVKRASVACLALACLLFLSPAPAYAQEATAYQIDSRHSGFTKFAAAPTFPLEQKWVRKLPDLLSYPVIADGRVFVTSRGIQGAYGTKLFALDAATGKSLWVKNVPGTYNWSALTYGDGRLYVLNYNGLLRALDPATGTLIWKSQMVGQYSFTSAPTFSNGMVYVSGAGSGGTVYGVEAASGKIVWRQAVINGDDSSPAVSEFGVFVSYAADQAFAFKPLTGDLIWHHDTPYSGGGGKTTALAPYGLFIRDSFLGNFILNPKTGGETTTYEADAIPALLSSYWFARKGSVLTAYSVDTNVAVWSFQGDGTLATAPIVVNNAVVVGSRNGNVYFLGKTTGRLLWSVNVGTSIFAPDEQNVSQPLTGLTAGEGLILVPAGDTLMAFGNSGP